jgi:hypothetical protein
MTWMAKSEISCSRIQTANRAPNLAIELSDPKVADLVFTTSDQHFTFVLVSLIDRHGNIIAMPVRYRQRPLIKVA